MSEPEDVIGIDPFDPVVIRAAEDQQYEQAEGQSKDIKQYIRRRKQAYAAVFGKDSDDLRIVMADLASFCRAYESRFNASEKVHDMLEGRAEVFYRIMDYTRLSHDDLYLKLTAAKARQEKL